MSPLASRRCSRRAKRLSRKDVWRYLGQLDGWRLVRKSIRREIRFADFAAAIRFVNAMARIAQREDHHPDFAVHFDRVEIELSTHDVGGLSENDFILAAKLDRALRRTR